MSNQKEQTSVFHAPEFQVNRWVGAKGVSINPLKLSDFIGHFEVVYCFQCWCPECHSKGLPDLKKRIEALKEFK